MAQSEQPKQLIQRRNRPARTPNWTEITLPKSESASNPRSSSYSRRLILSLFFLTANSNFAADRNLPFSTARRRRHHGHGGESDRLRRATRPQATRRPLPPPVRAVAAVEARRGLERGRQPDPLPAAGHAAAAAAGAGAGRRAGHHQGGALRAGGSARRPRRARRRQAPTQILFIIWYCDMILSIGRPTWKVSWI